MKRYIYWCYNDDIKYNYYYGNIYLWLWFWIFSNIVNDDVIDL